MKTQLTLLLSKHYSDVLHQHLNITLFEVTLFEKHVEEFYTPQKYI